MLIFDVTDFLESSFGSQRSIFGGSLTARLPLMLALFNITLVITKYEGNVCSAPKERRESGSTLHFEYTVKNLF